MIWLQDASAYLRTGVYVMFYSINAVLLCFHSEDKPLRQITHQPLCLNDLCRSISLPLRRNNHSWIYFLHLLTFDCRDTSNIVWLKWFIWQRSFPYLPSEQNNSWKSLCDGNKDRLASSGRRRDQGGRKNVKWWLTALADCIQFKNNPRAILIFISEPSADPFGVF